MEDEEELMGQDDFLQLKQLNATTRPSMPGDRWFYKSLEECLHALGPAAYGPPDADVPYCNGTWDQVLCWPATPYNTTLKMACPPIRGLDPTKFGYKRCGVTGQWEGKVLGDYSRPQGWTNYTDCYTDESKKIYNKLFSKSNPEVIKEIAYGTRILEMTGLCLSLLSIAISLFIFCYFRSLRCDRTKIHKNLFVAIIIHVGLLLVVHVDQFIARTTGEEMAGVIVQSKGTIYDTKGLCEVLYTLVEYTKTVMFMWMFVEGMYLHQMLVISVFSGKPKYWLYYLLGWGVPLVLTSTWAIVNGIFNTDKCWFGYTFLPYFWILEAPRAAVITVNLGFLFNIIRVLLTKLRQSNSTEAVQVRKAVKAAIVLLPLLGANNFLTFVEAPLDDWLKFGIWTYTSQFLISFQGFFISLLYCFLNSEVQNTIRAHWERYHQARGGYVLGRPRVSRTMSMFTAVSEVTNNQVQDVVGLSPMNGHTQPYYKPPLTDEDSKDLHSLNCENGLLQEENMDKNSQNHNKGLLQGDDNDNIV